MLCDTNWNETQAAEKRSGKDGSLVEAASGPRRVGRGEGDTGWEWVERPRKPALGLERLGCQQSPHSEERPAARFPGRLRSSPGCLVEWPRVPLHMRSWACVLGPLSLLLDALWPKTLLLSFHNTFLKLHFSYRTAVPHWKVFLKGNVALEREPSCVPCFLSPIFFGIE